jgi:hypothetical protein
LFLARNLSILETEMKSNTHPTPGQRRASVKRIVAASEGRAPKGVRLIDFREPTADELAWAETMRPRARAALARDAARRKAAA